MTKWTSAVSSGKSSSIRGLVAIGVVAMLVAFASTQSGVVRSPVAMSVAIRSTEYRVEDVRIGVEPGSSLTPREEDFMAALEHDFSFLSDTGAEPVQSHGCGLCKNGR